jgi:O-antigen ligase
VARLKSRFSSEAVPFWALVVFLALVFLMGGGARADIQSLVILRPTAALFCGIGLWSLTRAHVETYRFLFGMAGAIIALLVAHLIPLPPSVWAMFPGRGLVSDIDTMAGLGAVWRPITLVPWGARNALYSLLVPLAVLILGVQLDKEQKYRLLIVVLGIGLASGLLGLLQSISDPHGPLYFYSITNNGAAVGFFSNRNHQAMLLASLFPMLAVYASAGLQSEEQVAVRGWGALAVSAVLVPLILVTGSRAGLFVGLVGLASAGLLYQKPNTLVSRKRTGGTGNVKWLAITLVVVCLGGLTVLSSRAVAFQRLWASDITEERFQRWPSIAAMAWKYFPFGSGAGSFVEVFQIDEPNRLLGLSYANHAHNDWLELMMTMGLPGLLLLLVSLWAFARATRAAFRAPLGEGRRAPFARLGAVILLICALGSIGDYPLRTPSLACLFVVAVLWLYPSDLGVRRVVPN